MKIINDKILLNKLIEKNKITSYFNTKNLEFSLYSYEKGELIAQADKKISDIIFLVEGAVTIYVIRDDGTQYTIAENKDFIILGDVEFITDIPSPFFIEVVKPLKVIALSIEKNKDSLKKDVIFLNFLLQVFSEKMRWLVNTESYSINLEDKVVRYIKNYCPNNILINIEKTANLLHCSRRQLQRVLKKLIDNNTLQKIKKGVYKLN